MLPLCQKALTLNKYTHPWQPYFQSCTSRSSKRGVINTSSEALFKDNHCFFEWSTTPTPSFLSFSLLLFSRFHLYVPWCPLSALFQVKLCGIKVKVLYSPLGYDYTVKYHQAVMFCKLVYWEQLIFALVLIWWVTPVTMSRQHKRKMAKNVWRLKLFIHLTIEPFVLLCNYINLHSSGNNFHHFLVTYCRYLLPFCRKRSGEVRYWWCVIRPGSCYSVLQGIW